MPESQNRGAVTEWTKQPIMAPKQMNCRVGDGYDCNSSVSLSDTVFTGQLPSSYSEHSSSMSDFSFNENDLCAQLAFELDDLEEPVNEGKRGDSTGEAGANDESESETEDYDDCADLDNFIPTIEDDDDLEFGNESERWHSYHRPILKKFGLPPISYETSSWEILPVPDVELQTNKRLPSCGSSFASFSQIYLHNGANGRKSVSFGSVHIRYHDQTIGDSPSVSLGPPLSLDWTFYELKQPIPVDDYERRRSPRRTVRQMMIPYDMRVQMFETTPENVDGDIIENEKAFACDKHRRKDTWFSLPAQKVEDVRESAAWKSRRIALRMPTRRSSISEE